MVNQMQAPQESIVPACGPRPGTPRGPIRFKFLSLVTFRVQPLSRIRSGTRSHCLTARKSVLLVGLIGSWTIQSDSQTSGRTAGSGAPSEAPPWSRVETWSWDEDQQGAQILAGVSLQPMSIVIRRPGARFLRRYPRQFIYQAYYYCTYAWLKHMSRVKTDHCHAARPPIHGCVCTEYVSVLILCWRDHLKPSPRFVAEVE